MDWKLGALQKAYVSKIEYGKKKTIFFSVVGKKKSFFSSLYPHDEFATASSSQIGLYPHLSEFKLFVMLCYCPINPTDLQDRTKKPHTNQQRASFPRPARFSIFAGLLADLLLMRGGRFDVVILKRRRALRFRTERYVGRNNRFKFFRSQFGRV